jgi:hypothetical protein
MAVLGQQLAPHLDVAILHRGQLPVDVRLSRVSLGPGQLPVQEGRIGLVFEVVDPGMWGFRGG